MSRAAQSSSTTPASAPSAFLMLRGNPNGSSTALIRSELFGSNSHPVDVGALVMLLCISDFSDKERIFNRKKYLDDLKPKREEHFERIGKKFSEKKFSKDYQELTSHAGAPVFKITSHLVWMRILNFLLHQNAFQTVPLVIPAEHFPSIDDQFDDLQSRALQTVQSAAPHLNVNFFSKNYAAGFEFACLLDSALNADLKTVTDITTKMHPDKLRRLLFAEHGTGKAITCLGRITVERTGTPLQMAIYDHDEEMVAFFKEKMDPVEFQRQCEAVIGTDYDAFLKKQEVEATALCAGLEDVFTQSLSAEFTVDGNYFASTTSEQCLRAIDAFINKLMDYVKNNPVHNPTILQRVYEIYSRLPSDFYRDCFFSQKVIGGVQSFLSARWLQHYAQGIDYLAENNEVPRRSFIFRDSSPHIDIRHLVGSCIGSVAFLNIFGAVSGRAVAYWQWWPIWFSAAHPTLQKLCRTKTASLQNFMPRVRSTRSCVMQ